LSKIYIKNKNNKIMKKIVAETLYEFNQSVYSENDELNELNLADIKAGVQKAGSAIKQAVSSPKSVLVSFIKGTEGKTDVEDAQVEKTFNSVFGYSFGKYPQLKAAAAKLDVASKFKLLKNSYDKIAANAQLNQPVLGLKNGQVLSGAVATKPSETAPGAGKI